MTTKLTIPEYMALRRRTDRATLTREATKPENIYGSSLKGKAASAVHVARSRGNGKYGAKPVEIDGVWFASTAEGQRYGQLELLQAAGEIRGLKLQPRFPFEISGELMFTYIADFEYTDGQTGRRVIEDVKGMDTPVYKLKKRIIEKHYGITIAEIRGTKKTRTSNGKTIRSKTNGKRQVIS